MSTTDTANATPLADDDASALYDLLVHAVQGAGYCTAATYTALHAVVASVSETDPDSVESCDDCDGPESEARMCICAYC